MIKLVIVESPYSGDIERNTYYALAACSDCIRRNETPFASHLFYPQFLDEDDEGERACGINCGLEWGRAAHRAAHTFGESIPLFTFLVVFYVDYGWSKGMEQALEFYTELGAECHIRRLHASPPENGSSQKQPRDEERG